MNGKRKITESENGLPTSTAVGADEPLTAWERHSDSTRDCADGCPFCKWPELAQTMDAETVNGPLAADWQVDADAKPHTDASPAESHSAVAVNASASDIAWRALRLKRKIFKLEEETDRLKAEFDTVCMRLPEIFAHSKVDRLTIDGATVYTRTQLRASKKGSVEMGVLCHALKQNNLGDFVKPTCHHQTIQAHVRQLASEIEIGDDFDWQAPLKDALGEEVYRCLNIYEEIKGIVMGFGNKPKSDSKSKAKKPKEVRNG